VAIACLFELIHHDGKQLLRVDNEASVPRLLKAGVIVGQKDFDAMAKYLQKRRRGRNI
jgi:hypothetical protein